MDLFLSFPIKCTNLNTLISAIYIGFLLKLVDELIANFVCHTFFIVKVSNIRTVLQCKIESLKTYFLNTFKIICVKEFVSNFFIYISTSVIMWFTTCFQVVGYIEQNYHKQFNRIARAFIVVSIQDIWLRSFWQCDRKFRWT